MMQYIKAFSPVLMVWVAFYLIELLCYKTFLKLNKKSSKKLPEGTENVNLKDASDMHKHFKLTFISYSVMIILSAIIPLTELRWILFFFCAMTLCPVFYDLFAVSGSKMFQSKERFLIALPLVLNLLIIAVTLLLHYFAYMYKDFTV